jgi:uncharacterized protein
MTDLGTPLSEDELTELDSFLLSDTCDDDTLSVDEAHGYLSGLAVLPQSVDRGDWLSFIWNDPEFTDNDEQDHFIQLMQRLNQEIINTLANGNEFEPLVIETEEEGVIMEAFEGWCVGFMYAVDQHQSVWKGIDNNSNALLAPIAKLAMLEDDEDPDMDDDEYSEWVDLLPGSVSGLYNYWNRPH